MSIKDLPFGSYGPIKKVPDLFLSAMAVFPGHAISYIHETD